MDTTSGQMVIPLRMAFVITSMPVGGAETLLFNLVKKLPARQVEPILCCLKEKGELGEQLVSTLPLYDRLIRHKYDIRVLGRLKHIFRQQRTDVVVTVGAGDKMFWGRLAARWARVPVVLSALHSTGWPDGVSRLNRLLTGLTDGFIGVAEQHGRFLRDQERFPAHKVFVISNGIDTSRFEFSALARQFWRAKLRIASDAPVVGIVAALRPEKNHFLFLETARLVADQRPDVRFVIVGDGPLRPAIEERRDELGLRETVLMLGTQADIPGILSMVDVFALTSDNEASPVSIMEALACERPVVSTHVGSVDELVVEGETGLLIPPGTAQASAAAWLKLIEDPSRCLRMGRCGRDRIVKRHSLESMADAYAALGRRLWLSAKGRFQPIGSTPR